MNMIEHTILTLVYIFVFIVLLLFLYITVRDYYFREKKTSENKDSMITFLLGGLVLAYLMTQAISQEIQIYDFKPHFNEYMSIESKFNADTYNNKFNSYIPGKIIVIDRESNNFDNIYFDLPDELKAKSPDEVGTVIWITCQNVFYGTYTDFAKGYRKECKLTIINKKDNSILYEKQFFGNNPSYIKTVPIGDEYGNRPDSEMADYIETLKIK